MSISRIFFAAVVLNDKYIYAIGGSDGYSCRSCVERYDPSTNEWKICSSMIEKRYNFGVGVLNGNIYVVGGITNLARPDESITDSVEMYIPSANKWIEVIRTIFDYLTILMIETSFMTKDRMMIELNQNCYCQI